MCIRELAILGVAEGWLHILPAVPVGRLGPESGDRACREELYCAHRRVALTSSEEQSKSPGSIEWRGNRPLHATSPWSLCERGYLPKIAGMSVAKVSFSQVFRQLTGRLLSTMFPKVTSEVLRGRFNWLIMHFSDLYYLVDVG